MNSAAGILRWQLVGNIAQVSKTKFKVEENNSPDPNGVGDPCDDYNWFRANFPHLVGTPIDPHAKLALLKETRSTCGPKANPDSNGGCDAPKRGIGKDVTFGQSDKGPGPDCFDQSGCGPGAVTEAQADRVSNLDPANLCGISANVGPEGDCARGEADEGQPSTEPSPDPCTVCSAEMQFKKQSDKVIVFGGRETSIQRNRVNNGALPARR